MSIQANFPNLKPTLLLDFANTKMLDPRITFTRASNATFYDGKTTAKAEENLLLYSQDVTNAAWTPRTSTTTANTVAAPDGTTTADTVTQGSSVSLPCGLTYTFGTALRPNVYTFSGYVKYKSSQFLSAKITSGQTSYAVAIIDLVANTATSYAQSGNCSNSSVTMTSVGSGWYRFTLTTTVVTTTIIDVSLFFSPSATPTVQSYGDVFITGDGTSGVYVWGFQFEERSSATAYTATTSSPITNYIPVLLTAGNNVARFDNNPTTSESLGLLIEEQRTNSHSSSTFNASYIDGVTIIGSAGIAPNGSLSALRIVASATNGNHLVDSYNAFPSTGTGAASLFVKGYGNISRCNLTYYDAGGGASVGAVFLLSGAGSTVFGPGQITPIGNGWYRVSVVATGITNSGSVLRITPCDSSGSYNFQGDGWSGLLIWGPQQEMGAFPTSYILTSGSQVTRSADAASMTGLNFSSWYRADEGTMYADATVYGLGTNGESYFFGGDTADSSSRFNFHLRSNGVYTQVGTSGSGYPGAIASGSYVGSPFKAASAYKNNDFAASVNAGAVATNTSTLRSWTPTNIGIGYEVNSNVSFLNGTMRKLAFYPKRLTNAQLQALTS